MYYNGCRVCSLAYAHYVHLTPSSPAGESNKMRAKRASFNRPTGAAYVWPQARIKPVIPIDERPDHRVGAIDLQAATPM